MPDEGYVLNEFIPHYSEHAAFFLVGKEGDSLDFPLQFIHGHLRVMVNVRRQDWFVRFRRLVDDSVDYL